MRWSSLDDGERLKPLKVVEERVEHSKEKEGGNTCCREGEHRSNGGCLHQ